MIWSREFAMPNAETFSLPPVARLLDKWLADVDVVIDPFARNSTRGTLTNDLNPNTTAQYHLLAEEFVNNDLFDAECAGAVLFDPPYSPRQIAECYQQVGRVCGVKETQNARLYKTVKGGLDRLLRIGGIAICCGWNSMGFGIGRGYEMLEILLVMHGAAHNDTIVTVERKGGAK